MEYQILCGGINMQNENKTFEEIKHIDEQNNEFWLARELQSALQYSQWRRFEETIRRAKIACKNSNQMIEEHFADVGKTIKMPKRCGKISKRLQIITLCLLFDCTKW
jgi:biotin-(acetyl-CoA carboxylase) ligase